jgi:leucyl aminopeptidase
MLKITTSKKLLSELPAKYCRLVLTEDTPSVHRFVETVSGVTEYRMGAGKWAEIDARAFRTLVRSIVQATKGHQVEALAIDMSTFAFPKLATYGEAWLFSTLAENLLLADYEFTTFKTKKDTKKKLAEVVLAGSLSKEAEAGLKRGEIVGHYTNEARDIANTPASHMTPTALGNAAKSLMKGLKVTTTVLGEKEIKKLKMGALLAVGQGTRPRQIPVLPPGFQIRHSTTRRYRPWSRAPHR